MNQGIFGLERYVPASMGIQDFRKGMDGLAAGIANDAVEDMMLASKALENSARSGDGVPQEKPTKEG